jgi:hypothetical protein
MVVLLRGGVNLGREAYMEEVGHWGHVHELGIHPLLLLFVSWHLDEKL